jgi:hypothetical protein
MSKLFTRLAYPAYTPTGSTHSLRRRTWRRVEELEAELAIGPSSTTITGIEDESGSGDRSTSVNQYGGETVTSCFTHSLRCRTRRQIEELRRPGSALRNTSTSTRVAYRTWHRRRQPPNSRRKGKEGNPSGNWGRVSTEKKLFKIFVWPCVQGRRNNKDPAPCVSELDRIRS